MSAIDIFVRAAAIAVLLFVMAFLALTFAGLWLDGIAPFRQASVFAAISIVSAGIPILLIYLTRAASGTTGGGEVRARYFSVFTILLAGTATIVAALMVSGSLVV